MTNIKLTKTEKILKLALTKMGHQLLLVYEDESFSYGDKHFENTNSFEEFINSYIQEATNEILAELEEQSLNDYYHEKYYNSRDEFLNDDGMSENEKIEIIQSILEAEQEKEKGE